MYVVRKGSSLKQLSPIAEYGGNDALQQAGNPLLIEEIILHGVFIDLPRRVQEIAGAAADFFNADASSDGDRSIGLCPGKALREYVQVGVKRAEI